MVHARTLDEQVLTFIVSGKLWRNSLIMQDEETGSLWSHISGAVLDGALTGQQLDMLPSVQTSWAEWRAEHPQTKVLQKDQPVLESRYERYFEDPERIGMFRTAWLQDRLPGKSLVHGVTRGLHALAVPDEQLGRGEVLNVEVGGDPVAFYRAADGGVMAFIARASDDELELAVDEGRNGFGDTSSGSIWDLEAGRAVEGKHQGERLAPVVVRTTYWFAWSVFYPNTRVAD